MDRSVTCLFLTGEQESLGVVTHVSGRSAELASSNGAFVLEVFNCGMNVASMTLSPDWVGVTQRRVLHVVAERNATVDWPLIDFVNRRRVA